MNSILEKIYAFCQQGGRVEMVWDHKYTCFKVQLEKEVEENTWSSEVLITGMDKPGMEKTLEQVLEVWDRTLKKQYGEVK